MDNLPVELVFVIFHKVPIKSIGRSMCVSKKWLSLIKSPRFISTYNIRSKQLMVYQESIYEVSFNFDHPGFDSYKLVKLPFRPDNWYNFLRGICNGLLCIVDSQGASVLWNPTIKKKLTLPHFTSPYSNVKCQLFPGLVFDSLANDYKVVTYVSCASGPNYLQVFSLVKYSWQTDPIITPRYDVQKDSLSFNSFIHWIAADDDKRFILGFDVSSQVVQVIKLPQSVAKSKYFLEISVYNDYTIGVCYCSHEQVDIWVMMKYGNVDSWNKKWTFNVAGCTKFQWIDPSSLSFCFRKSGELFLQATGMGEDNKKYQKNIVLLDPRTGAKKFVVKDASIFYGKAFSYFDKTLVLLDHPSAESDSIL